MKVLFTTLCFIAATITASSAQILRIGVRGGVNISDVRFDMVTIGDRTVASAKDSPGYQIALVTRFSIPKFLQISPELQFTSHDYRYTVGGGTRSGEVRVSTKRLELPVMIGFNIKALRIFAGPVFRLSHSEKPNKKYVGLDVKYNDSDVGLVAGVGLDIGKFFIDARYSVYPKTTYNLMSLGSDHRYVKMKRNAMWQFSAGFFF